MPVYFHSEKTCFQLKDKKRYRQWIEDVVGNSFKSVGNINIIFTSNDHLLKINKQYLNHNYYTDVVTFNYNENDIISGDVFISIDQVEINSKELDIMYMNELSRVMIHGVLHLLGFGDDNSKEIKTMRMMENAYLKWLKEYGDGKEV